MTTTFSSPPREHAALRQVGLGLVELVLVSGLYVVYKLGRLLAADRGEAARAHARLVHHLERVLHLPSEAAIQGAVHSVRLLEAANVYYVSVHFPVTIAFLVWGFVVRPRAEYLWARRLLVVITLLGLAAHIAFPLAPPRMFPRWGFLDTMTTYGPSAYDGASGALVNQYAAMPSLHIGWAVLIAVVVCRTGPRWLAAAACLHALTTIAVVIVTANHWLLDGVVAMGLLGVALLVVPGPARACLPIAGGCQRRPGRAMARRRCEGRLDVFRALAPPPACVLGGAGAAMNWETRPSRGRGGRRAPRRTAGSRLAAAPAPRCRPGP
jgi:PAP2 superfamily protein